MGEEQETPRPPETAEFGAVTVGGPAHEYPVTDGVRVTKFCVGPYENNVYVVSSGDAAVIVDGADDAARILREVEGQRVDAIVETHDHHDHVQALPELVDALDVPVYANDEDTWPVETRPLKDGDVVRVGDHELHALHTPGHTPGSTCYLIGGFLFSGDTLFPGGPGNTGGDSSRFARIMTSLDALFAGLPDDTRICPGHGIDSTIGRERAYVDVWRARGW
jgi:glyoxylase-like metal-dependent hydrolase (beta-lactamase superfamily II)